MVQIHDPTSIEWLPLLAAVLVYVGAYATTGAFRNASTSSLPAPSTCPATSINHIVQILPQQCFATPWPGKVNEQETGEGSIQNRGIESSVTGVEACFATPTLSKVNERPTPQKVSDPSSQQFPKSWTPVASSTNDATAKPKIDEDSDDAADGDSDSPLDNAHFLSFEDWKKQNLAKVGQSADTLGAGRSGASEPRRRPGSINNALDSLGEDTEIEIDFGGFVNPQVTASGTPEVEQWNPKASTGPDGNDDNKESSAPKSKAHARSKDAGVTCKERSNYASFDCASTVLKANPECKSATSVLVENKDSYMLNECSANNKFFIVELCDDILVDTVVLANFEFFSSIFRTFRVSVSDRYPVKLDKWRELGIFEAKNTRGVQPFLIEEPQIWARYLRIEFLTHYGHEYYCPVSLLRVHGTTMMEEFNHELKNSKGEDEIEDEEQSEESPSVHDVVTADNLRKETKTVAEQPEFTVSTAVEKSTASNVNQTNGSKASHSSDMLGQMYLTKNFTPWHNNPVAQMAKVFVSGDPSTQICSRIEAPGGSSTTASAHSTSNTTYMSDITLPSSTAAHSEQATPLSAQRTPASDQAQASASPTSAAPDTADSATNENVGTSSNTISPSSNPASKPYISSTHPSPPNPTTQESFFKSVHKRLQLLESNSTLSLQYIEEQSRILRDAFAKVEKRQLSKTNTFLAILNSTVLTEVREFRTQYDQIWQSTVLELSSQRHQSQIEIAALSTRLTLMADELLFQKRIAILQFLLILLCLGLALFSRGSAGVDYLEHVVNKSSVNLSRYASNLDSPPGSPSSTRPPSRYGFFSRAANSLHRRSPSEESMGAEGREGTKSPSIEYEPPTPTSLSEESAGGESPERGNSARGEYLNGMLSPDNGRGSSSSGGTTLVNGDGHGSS